MHTKENTYTTPNICQLIEHSELTKRSMVVNVLDCTGYTDLKIHEKMNEKVKCQLKTWLFREAFPPATS